MAFESAWSLALEVAIVVSTIVSFTLLGRTLGPSGYGGYASLYALVGPLVTLASSGVMLALLEHVVRRGEDVAATARSCISITLAMGTVLTAGAAAVAFRIIDGLSAAAIVALIATELITVPVVQVAAATVQAVTGFAPAARIRLVMVVGRIVVLVGLYLSGRLTVGSLGVVSVIWTGCLGLVATVLVGRANDFSFRPGRVRLAHLWTNLGFSVGISASALNNDGDKVVMASRGLQVDTGLYAAAFRIVNFGMVPVGSLVNATHNRFLAHDDDRRGQHTALALRFTAIAAAYGLLFGVALVVAAPLLPLVIGDAFSGSVPMVRWLAPIVFLRAIGTFPPNGLLGLGRLGVRTVVVVANAVVAIALYVALIPRWGWQGAVAGTLIAEATESTSTWVALIVCERRADRAAERGAAAPVLSGDAP